MLSTQSVGVVRARAVSGNKRKPCGQDFFDEITVKVLSSTFVAQLYQSLIGQLVNGFGRESALA